MEFERILIAESSERDAPLHIIDFGCVAQQRISVQHSFKMGTILNASLSDCSNKSDCSNNLFLKSLYHKRHSLEDELEGWSVWGINAVEWKKVYKRNSLARNIDTFMSKKTVKKMLARYNVGTKNDLLLFLHKDAFIRRYLFTHIIEVDFLDAIFIYERLFI